MNYSNNKNQSLSSETRDLYQEERSNLVLQLNYAVFALVIFYCFFYYFTGAITAFRVMLFGAFIISPLSIFLEKKGLKIFPRFLLIISCNFYIYLTGVSFHNEVNTEFYYIPATMLALLALYEYEERYKSYLGILLPLIFWILQLSFGTQFFNSSWFAPAYSITVLKIFNFFGAFCISLIFVNLFRKSLYTLQIKMNVQNEEKQKAMEQVIELLEQNTKYMNQAQSVAKMGNWRFNLSSGKFTWSKQMYSIFPESFDLGEPSIERLTSTIHPLDRQLWEEKLMKCLSDGLPCEMRFRILTREMRDDIFLWAEASGEAEFSIDGKVTALFGTCQDITERLHLENSLLEQRQFLDVVLNNVPSMIFVKDFQKNLSFSLFNKAGEDLLGLKKEELIGKNDFDLFPKQQAEFFVTKDQEVFNKGTLLRIEQEEIQTPKGLRILQTQKVPTYDREGKNQFLIGISSDITDEVMAQRTIADERAKSLHQSKLATLGEMAAGMAHEINNPLAIIDGMVNLIPNNVNNIEKVQDRVEAIKKAVFRISKIISGLKKFSRSSDAYHRASYKLSDILNEVFILTKAKKERHLIELSLHLVHELNIYCDEVEIEQVFVNLINNAIDAIKDQSTRWIKIQVMGLKEKIVIQVIDSGPGIAIGIRDKIFNPFFTTKRVGEGTGLGLSISKGIIEAHAGTLDLKTDNSNTCFEIILPLEGERKVL